MKRSYKLLAVLLVVALLFSGCSSVMFRQLLQGLLGQRYVPFNEIEYTRPDMEKFRTQLDVCLQGAEEDTAVRVLMDKVFDLYEIYHLFYTNYKLANVYYYKDMTDTYWAEEYTYCVENSAEVDAGIDQLLYALAGSRLKSQLQAEEYFGPGYFDSYTGQSLWDETFTELMAQELKLQNEYDALSAQALELSYYSETFYSGIGAQMEQLFLELVALRQDIAQHAGYDDYLQFAYDFYYDRDYTPSQAMGYMTDVQRELVALYEDLPSDVWQPRHQTWTESQMFDYVESSANAMGGKIGEAFTLLKDYGYYDIAYSPNKYNASFETYLQYYYAPFVFVNPQGNGSDPLVFAHEFGHFCNDYASNGTVCGVDVSEVFSQSMEYLSLFYGEKGETLKKMKLAGSLSTFVEQSAYASFEHRVYLLEDEELTAENVRLLYEETADAYGFERGGLDGREYVLLTHLFIAPMYMVSYVVSNDVAMQIYQAEDTQSGSGRKLLEDNLDTEEMVLLSFVESAGLTDPFEKGRLATLRKTFEAVLG